MSEGTRQKMSALCGLKSGEDADVEGFMAGPLLAFERSRVVWVHPLPRGSFIRSARVG